VFAPAPLCSFRRHPLQQTAVNRSVQIGPQECLILTMRYLDELAAGPTSGWRRLALRRTCHRRLYYSRKHAPRTAEVLALEAALAQRVGRGWAPWLWAWHRLAKPFVNLARKVQARGARARAAARPRTIAEFERE
jgi:hypothetical protein